MRSANTPSGRCGHTKDQSAFPGPPGSVTCWRSTWRNNRCIWHDDSENKPIQRLIDSRTDLPERLDDAILRKTGLRDAISFKNCNLSDADFSHSNLMGADFSNSQLGGAEFKSTNLPGANFSQSYLHAANLKDANLTNANLEGAKISDSTILNHVSITAGTSFKGKSGWELDADKEAIESSILAKHYSPRFSALGRGNSGTRDLEYAAKHYRVIIQLLRENYLHQSPELTIREKNVRRKQALAEREYWTWLKLAFYRWPLGYGERIRNVLTSSFITIIGFGLLFPFIGGIEATSQDATRFALGNSPFTAQLPKWAEVLGANLYFSTVTFTTLGYGDIQPTSPLIQTLASIESLVGALLMAFLVFVLGRRATW